MASAKMFENGLANEDTQRNHATPERVVNFVRRIIRNEKLYTGRERRTHLRYPITMPVKATPLTDDQRPAGEPFLAVSRDISIGGMCLYHLYAVSEKYLELDLKGSGNDELHVVLEVVRCRQAGPLYEIAGQFIGYL
ncbi:MAG TPA: PilZ domain-containing protein [Pirellulales bacterium]|jgi:hypothetical protein